MASKSLAIELSRRCMGGLFYVKHWPRSGQDHSQLSAKIERAFDELDRLENLLTDFRPSSFNEINDHAGVSAVEVPSEVYQLIERSLAFSALTKGAFDISYASVGHLWRKARQQDCAPDEAQLAQALAWVDYRKIVMDPKAQTVFLPSPHMRIGLGGIGKGHAVDQLYQKLLDLGLENFYVNGSGDIRVHSRADAPRPWRIGIRNPFANRNDVYAGYLQLAVGAVATSGNYINYVPSLGKAFHHVLDPKMGRPAQGIASATVLADEAIIADVSATVLMIMGVEQGLAWLDECDLSGFLITEQGKVIHSRRSIKALERYQRELQA